MEKSADGLEATMRLITKVAHGLTEGSSKEYSSVVSRKDWLAKLHWRCLGLSSAPISVERFWHDHGKSRSNGQRVRFIDIPSAF